MIYAYRSIDKENEIARERGFHLTREGKYKPIQAIDNLADLCIPRTLDKFVKGRVTHVSTIAFKVLKGIPQFKNNILFN